MVYGRYLLLKQGENPELDPELKSFLDKMYSLSVDFGSAPERYEKTEVASAADIKSQLDYSSLQSFINQSSPTAIYSERLLLENETPSKAKDILDNINRPGLPGFITQVKLYLETLDAIERQQTWISLHTFETIDELYKYEKKKYHFDIFTLNPFRTKYMDVFGDLSIEDETDPSSLTLCEAIYHRRIQFLQEHGFSVSNEYANLLRLLKKQGRYDQSLFMKYLASRPAKEDEKRKLDYCGTTYKTYGMRMNDLDRDYFRHLFPATRPAEFLMYFFPSELLELYEEQCLLHGQEIKPEYLSSSALQELEKRKTCRVLDSNQIFYRVGDAVQVSVEMKNVSSVEVRLFELNTLTYYQQKNGHCENIDPSLDLDGLQPLLSFTKTYDLPAMRYHVESFDFPMIDHRGVFVVDFLAGLLNSRFLIRMGSLHALVRPSIAGYGLTVLDESGNPVKEKVKVMKGTRVFLPQHVKSSTQDDITNDDDNSTDEILIPFQYPGEGGNCSLLLVQEVQPDWYFVVPQSLTIQAEEYSLHLAGNVDQESIVKGNEECQILLRPTVRLNGMEFPLSLLKDVTLTIVSVAAQDVRTEKTFHPTLVDGKEFTYKFRVLDTMVKLEATLTASAPLVNGALKRLSASLKLYQANETVYAKSSTAIDVKTTLFRRTKPIGHMEYIAQLYGISGEPIPHKACEVTIQSALVQRSHSQSLITDANGQVNLGELKDIVAVKVNGKEFCLYPDTFDVRLQWECSEEEDVQAVLPLVHPNLQTYHLHCTKSVDTYTFQALSSHLVENDGYVLVKGLPAGSYKLNVRGVDFMEYSIGIEVRRSVVPMRTCNAFAVYYNWARRLQTLPLSLTAGLVHDRTLRVHLQGGTDQRRVHVLIKHLFESKMLGTNLQQGDLPALDHHDSFTLPSSQIVNDRSLPEEYAYILNRQSQKRELPGNMLPHPGPLLRPVEFSDTSNSVQQAKDGKAFGAAKTGHAGGVGRGDGGKMTSARWSLTCAPRQYPACDAISRPSELIVDLPLNEEGVGLVDLSHVGEMGVEVEIVGMDSEKTVQRHLYIPEASQEKAAEKGVSTLLSSQVLQSSLDVEKHFIEEKMISMVKEGSPLRLSSKNEIETIHSLADVYLLLKTLTSNQDLADFSFLLSWDTLSDKEKYSHYNRHNCSELNVFIYFRDRPFFDRVILPYLQCKMEKSFLDCFLTGEDLTDFLHPNLFKRLNAFERALLCGQVDEEQAALLVQGMGVCGGSERMSMKAFTRVFHTALKMKSMENPVVDAMEEEEEEDAETETEDEGEWKVSCMQYSPTSPSYESVLSAFDGIDPSIPPPPPSNSINSGMSYRRPMRMMCMARSSMPMESRETVSLPVPPPPPMRSSRAPQRMNRIMMEPEMEMVMACDSYESCACPPNTMSIPPPSMACLSYSRQVQNRSNDIALRKQHVEEKHYESLQNTKEYVEGFYYNQTQMYAPISLVPSSPFWEAFARHRSSHSSEPFLSKDFIYCTHSLSEILFCLAVIGVPITPTPHSLVTEHGGFTLYAHTPLFVFHKVLKEAALPENESSLLVMQKYIDNNNRYCTVKGEKMERYMPSNEFLPLQPYTCKIIVTNTDALPQNVMLLYQIPEGAYPLSDGFTLRTESLHIQPYSTTTFTYEFYFPRVGDFKHYPAQLFDDITSGLLAFARPAFQPLHVTHTLTTVDKTSWRDIAYFGSKEDVWEYLSSHTLSEVDWKVLRWRLRDKAFYLQLINFLRQRGYYNASLWEYGPYFNLARETGEYLSTSKNLDWLGMAFTSPLLTLNPTVENFFQIREYKPFIYSRSFRLGSSRKITNDKLEKQYEKFLTLLMQKHPSTDDWMVMAYYLLLLDRVADARTVFTQRVCRVQEGGRLVCREDCTSHVQFDYMFAYFACFQTDLEEAKAICAKYTDYPVLYWRTLFDNVQELIHDMEGTLEQAVEQAGDEEAMDMTNLNRNVIREKRLKAASEASLSISKEGHAIVIKYSNLPKVEVNLYEINAELKFSNSPFMRDESSDALFVRANHTDMIALPPLLENQLFATYSYSLPEDFTRKNLLVEVRHEALRETCFAFNTRLSVVVSAKSGQLRVFDQESKGPLSNAYVKVYVKSRSGKSEFLKDGFTDIRGYFDYFSVSSDVGKNAEKVAVFVDKEGYGSCIREMMPPNL